jgi:hypothetical protein
METKQFFEETFFELVYLRDVTDSIKSYER